jgi:hypothetical protein
MRVFKIRIIRSKRLGIPTVGVGGGAYTNTFEGRFILRRGQLPPPLFIYRSGNLACDEEQAMVVVKPGDIMVFISGHRGVGDPIEGSHIVAGIFKGEIEKKENGEEFAIFHPVEFRGEIPPSVWEGLLTYHNRSGDYFVAPKN